MSEFGCHRSPCFSELKKSTVCKEIDLFVLRAWYDCYANPRTHWSDKLVEGIQAEVAIRPTYSNRHFTIEVTKRIPSIVNDDASMMT